ncbi:MAG: heparin lyase I family protein [Candidatus Bathyarchaeia archaeon]
MCAETYEVINVFNDGYENEFIFWDQFDPYQNVAIQTDITYSGTNALIADNPTGSYSYFGYSYKTMVINADFMHFSLMANLSAPVNWEDNGFIVVGNADGQFLASLRIYKDGTGQTQLHIRNHWGDVAEYYEDIEWSPYEWQKYSISLNITSGEVNAYIDDVLIMTETLDFSESSLLGSVYVGMLNAGQPSTNYIDDVTIGLANVPSTDGENIVYFDSSFAYAGEGDYALNAYFPPTEPCGYEIEKGTWHWVNANNTGNMRLIADPENESRTCLQMMMDNSSVRPLDENQHIKLYNIQGRESANWMNPYISTKEAFYNFKFLLPSNFSVQDWRLVWQFNGEENVYGNPDFTFSPQFGLVFDNISDTLELQADNYYYADNQDRRFELIDIDDIPKNTWVNWTVYVKQGSAFRAEDGNVTVWINGDQLFTSNTFSTSTVTGIPFAIWGIGNYGGPEEEYGQNILMKDVKVTNYLINGVTGEPYVPDSYTADLSITSPTNTTYNSSPSIVLADSGNDTSKVFSYNAVFSNGTSTGNQSWTEETTLVVTSNVTCTLYAYVEGDYASDSAQVSFTVTIITAPESDVMPPTYTVLGHTGSTGGVLGSFYMFANDNVQLSSFIYSYKVGSGSYTNLTATAFSSTPGWANVSRTLPAQNVTYYFKYYLSDSSGNWNVTSEESFAVTYVSSEEPEPTPTPSPTPTPTATPTSSPLPTAPIRMGETSNLYFRTDTYTTQGVSAYGLDADYTSSTVQSNTLFDVDLVQYAMRVYLVSSATQKTELTSTYSAIITLTQNATGNYTGLVYGYWTMPESDVILGYQGLQVDIYSYTPSNLWMLEKSFITPVLITKEILSSPITLTLYVNVSFVTPSTLGGTSDVTSYFMFGDVTHKSGFYGLTVTTPLQSEIQLWRLTSGDYVGFEIGAYVDVIGEAFYVLLLILFAGVLYFRYGHFGTVAFFFVLFGGVGGLVWLLVPPWAAAIVSAFVILGTSFIVWRVIR